MCIVKAILFPVVMYDVRKCKVKVLAAQWCPTLCDPMDCSLPSSSVHGILQERILEQLPCPPPGDLPEPGMEPNRFTNDIMTLLPTSMTYLASAGIKKLVLS